MTRERVPGRRELRRWRRWRKGLVGERVSIGKAWNWKSEPWNWNSDWDLKGGGGGGGAQGGSDVAAPLKTLGFNS